jgi:hypothetical protein
MQAVEIAYNQKGVFAKYLSFQNFLGRIETEI